MSGRDEALDGERLTVKEAAQALDLSEKIVRGLIARGELLAYRPAPRKTFINRGDLDDFIEGHLRTPINT